MENSKPKWKQRIIKAKRMFTMLCERGRIAMQRNEQLSELFVAGPRKLKRNRDSRHAARERKR